MSKNNLKPLSTYNESKLALLLKERDQAAFLYLYDNYIDALYNVAYLILKDEDFAYNAVHDALILIWENIRQYDSEKGRLFTWMHQIVRRKSLEILKSKVYKDSCAISPMPEGHLSIPHPDTPQEHGMRGMLVQLKKEHQILIEFSYFRGYKQDEIAEMLEIPLGTVKTRLRAALIVLRSIMQLH